jgi:hypothetical protein
MDRYSSQKAGSVSELPTGHIIYHRKRATLLAATDSLVLRIPETPMSKRAYQERHRRQDKEDEEKGLRHPRELAYHSCEGRESNHHRDDEANHS